MASPTVEHTQPRTSHATSVFGELDEEEDLFELDEEQLFEIDLESGKDLLLPDYYWETLVLATGHNALLANCLLPITDLSTAIPICSKSSIVGTAGMICTTAADDLTT